MPRKPINYSKTHFYKLVCKDTNITDCYVGHTTEWTKRKSEHKLRCCNPNHKKHHYKVYQCMRENGGWENWEMILIDTLKCENNLQARAKEREFTEQIKPTLNMWKPLQTEEEKTSYFKEYYVKNKEQKLLKNKEYRDNIPEGHYKRFNAVPITCSCGATINKGNISRHNQSKKHQAHLKTTI